MTIRASKKTVTFRRPFVLGGFDKVLPAGAYGVHKRGHPNAIAER